MKAAIYNRKSTDKEDAQVSSIEDQNKLNLLALRKNGDELVETYTDIGSAKKPYKRKDFQRLVDDVKTGKIEVAYCWKLNRLARNPVDAGEIQWLLQEGILKAIVTSERTYLPGDNVIQIVVEFGMATQFSRDLAKDVMRGMREKAEMGWRPGPPPVGYMSDYGGVKGEKKIYTDPERFALMRKCWETLLTGAYTVKHIHEMATKDWGLTRLGARGKMPRPIGLTTMYNYFTQPFYFGEYEWAGNIHQGKHEPMITREEFERSQEILGRRGKPIRRKYEHPFPGVIRCGECDSVVVLNLVEKKCDSGECKRRYRYLRCGHNRKVVKCTQKKAVRMEEIEDEVLSKIAEAQAPQAFIEWALQELKVSAEDRKEEQAKEVERLREALRLTEKKIDSLLDLRLSQPTLFTPETFGRKMKTLEEERRSYEEHIRNAEEHASKHREELVDALTFSLKLRQRFEKGGRDTRREILYRLKEHIQLTDGRLDFLFCEPFRTLARENVCLERKHGALQLYDVPLLMLKSEVRERVVSDWRSGWESNPRIGVLQTPALPLGYRTGFHKPTPV